MSMSMIQKVAHRIQEARRRTGTTGSDSSIISSSEQPPVSYSNSPAGGQVDSQGFCVVDETERTDLEQVTEDLFGDFDYENEREEPKHKPLKQEPKRPWREASKDVYEQQLEILQEQLTSTLIEKQTLESEFQKHRRQSQKEVEDLSKKVKDLSGRLSAHRGSSDSVGGGSSTYAGGLQVSTSAEGYQEVTMSSSEDNSSTGTSTGTRSNSIKKGFIQTTKYWVYEILADFTEDPGCLEGPPPEDPPLAYKKLKDNVQRFMLSIKPWRETAQHTQDILQWKHIAESLVIFLLYMYCVWSGWVITVALLVAIFKLSVNYLHASGLAEQFGFPYPYKPQPTEVPGLANKIQLVKKVAQTAQNASSDVSDALEKTQNLLLWHQPEATRRLFFFICAACVASLFLSNSYMLTLVGLFVGFKLFIIDNIYRKYPKVQEKYDTVHRLWKTLPTDAELYKRQSLTEEEFHSQSIESVSSDGSSSTQPSGHAGDHAFSQRFALPSGEHPLPSWDSGKRCSIMDRDKPLSLTRSGRLYMTQNYLCFERMSHALRDSDRISIPLVDVVLVKKAKPFAVLPGSGMSIEITCSNRKKYLFSAILGRDQVCRNILDQGMVLGLSWGSDITRVAPSKTTSPEKGGASLLAKDLQSF
ncbi:GRAM domain-containing protein 4-like isoform X2 [Halichondria panicea]|uniref:GRAM domain-containing protein 4-like isoform X2 n=1 Tax=Halichondria panicea TaxID=6063 RepID=UPI00312B6322